MKDEIFKRLDALAGALGVATKELWRILLQQARVEAYATGAYALIGLGFIGIAGILLRKAFKVEPKRGSYDIPAWFIIAAAVAIPGFTLLFVNLYNIWTPLFNPEYYALHEILDVLRGSK